MPLLCRKLLALGGQMKDKLTERKRTGPAGIETGTRREDVGAAVTRAGEGGRGGVFGEPGSGINGRKEKKNCPPLPETKTGSNFIFREKGSGCHGDGGANRRPRLPRASPSSPFNPALHSFAGGFDSQTWTWFFQTLENPSARLANGGKKCSFKVQIPSGSAAFWSRGVTNLTSLK